MTSNPIISMQNITKRFGDFVAVDDVSIDIEPGEFFALLGPSGCGKTTLLRMISGFEIPTEGDVMIDGEDMTTVPPNKRPVNMVFQSYAVFPHMTVAKNVAYGLKVDGISKAEIKERVDEALKLVQLDQFKNRMPDQLSGGQRQRVALARALVKRPRVLLLDEPLSALDAKLRDAMRLELVKLQQNVGVTFVMVTHDQSEALAMADRVAVINKGELTQMASPEELYDKPANAFVADFIGRINFFEPQTIEDKGSSFAITCSCGDVEIDKAMMEGIDAEPDKFTFGIRPEKVKVSQDTKDAREIAIEGTLGDIAFQGESSFIEIILPDGKSITAFYHSEDMDDFKELEEGTPITASWDKDAMLVLAK